MKMEPPVPFLEILLVDNDFILHANYLPKFEILPVI